MNVNNMNNHRVEVKKVDGWEFAACAYRNVASDISANHPPPLRKMSAALSGPL